MDLKAKTEKLGKSKIKLKITLAQKDFAKFRKKALKKLSRDVEIAGFRKGKAPEKMVIDNLGETRIESEALEMALTETTYLAMARENIIPLESPKVAISQFEKNKDLIYSLEVSVLPEVVLGNYKNVKIKKEKIKVADGEIEKAIEDLRKRMATPLEKKEGLKKGDWAEIDFEGIIKGVKIDKLSSAKFPFVVGEVKFVPGFEENLIGLKKGSQKEFELEIPKNSPDKDIAGAQVKFKIKLNELKKINLPELNNEFAQKLGAKDIGDLKKRMQEAIIKQKELDGENKYRLGLVDKIASKTKIELPQTMINQERERILGELTRQIGLSGLTLEQFLESQKKSKEDLDKDLAVQAEKNVRLGLTLSKIAQRENIEAKGAEVELEIERLVNEGARQGAKKADLVKTYESSEGRRYLENVIKNRKTIDKIVELNKSN